MKPITHETYGEYEAGLRKPSPVRISILTDRTQWPEIYRAVAMMGDVEIAQGAFQSNGSGELGAVSRLALVLAEEVLKHRLGCPRKESP